MITCETCQSSEFYRKEGATYCKACHSESQEHGADTTVDEATLGMYNADVASTLRKM